MVKDEKLVGYILLILGVVLLVFSVCEMVAVYTGAASAPNLITLSDISWPTTDGGVATLMSGAEISQLPNLFFWFLLMVFVLLAGGKIAQLGVSMLKDVKVEVKDSLTNSAVEEAAPVPSSMSAPFAVEAKKPSKRASVASKPAETAPAE